VTVRAGAVRAAWLPRIKFGRPRWPRGSKFWLVLCLLNAYGLGSDTVEFLLGEDVKTSVGSVGLLIGFTYLFGRRLLGPGTSTRWYLVFLAGLIAGEYAHVFPELHGVSALTVDAGWLAQSCWFYSLSRDEPPKNDGDTT
jgi:hypothetical protein